MKRSKMSRMLAASIAICAPVGVAGHPAAAQTKEAAASGETDCPWVGSTASAAVKAAQVLAQMTQDEKFAVITAQRPVVGIPRLCIPGIYQQGGPGGVNQGAHGVTQLPAPIALGATFDPDLAYRYGSVIGAEIRGKGTAMVGAPTLDPSRHPFGGRTYESYGEEPYLTGTLATQTVRGIQSNDVISLTKHYAAYTQQIDRLKLSVTGSERALREVYLMPFEMVVKNAEPGAIMCSYSRINGSPSCGNPWLLNDVLKHDWGFNGAVGNDWGAHLRTGMSVDQVVNAGLDLEIPKPDAFADPLRQALAEGKVTQARIDEMAFRNLRSLFAAGLVDHPLTGNPEAVVTTPEHQQTALDVAEASAVLLKNEHGILPLGQSIQTIAVIGPGAQSYPLTTGGLSAGVHADRIVTVLDGITKRAGDGVTVEYAEGVDPITPFNSLVPGLSPVPDETLTAADGRSGLDVRYFGDDRSTPLETGIDTALNHDWRGGVLDNTLLYPQGRNLPPEGTVSAEWTGTFTAPGSGEYTFSILNSGAASVAIDGETVADLQTPAEGQVGNASWTATLDEGQSLALKISAAVNPKSMIRLGWEPPQGVVESGIATAVAVAAQADIAIVVANAWSQESFDQPNMNLPGNQDRLIRAVSAANKHTIVVLNTGTAVLMPWIEDVEAVLESWYPGQEGGTALAALLWGDVDPSGRLPITFPAAQDQSPVGTDPKLYPGVDLEVELREGVNVGYKWYVDQGVEPLFAFGYGLSYADFELSDLQVAALPGGPGNVAVSITVSNTGENEGSQVVQLYVGMPDSVGGPALALRGFIKAELKPGEAKRVAMAIDPRDLAHWDEASRSWQVSEGDYTLYVGNSSALGDLRHTATVTIDEMIQLPATTGID
ncbi:glycoside hydrolase family 3 C-terminal domain-containing protein [Consotaella aegiceratis]|uniref:glycoside hydrolase family 3 C-terminal domain-containing protein n=1 Tax=Consotaella aegiceratis TaxID=3097961 RepID=UPI002F3E5419